MVENPRRLFRRGIALLRRGYPEDAVDCFEELIKIGYDTPAVWSWLGLAIARSRYGDIAKAEDYCKKAVKKVFYRPRYYVHLAEVYLIWGKKAKALENLKTGLNLDDTDNAALKELNKLGIRRKPPIPFLARSNPVNKYIGILLSRLGFRK